VPGFFVAARRGTLAADVNFFDLGFLKSAKWVAKF
jgi:hypothetical protein